jgi:hypothetical protein
MARTNNAASGRRKNRGTPRAQQQQTTQASRTSSSEPDSASGFASVTVRVPEAGKPFIQKAAELMREGAEPAAALRRAGGGFDTSDPPPSRDEALHDDEAASRRDQHQMARLRNRLETQEMRSAAEIGYKVRSLSGWRLTLAKMAGLIA